MTGVKIGNVSAGGRSAMLLIAGPCVIESEKHCVAMARRLKEIAGHAGIPFVFKASYDKANRMSLDSFRGPGLRKGLDILYTVKQKAGVAVLSDVHSTAEVPYASQVLDCIQIPALLCRQTDLVVAAAKTGRAVNIKKGQFLAPWDMLPIIRKAESTGNRNIIVTERGFAFGYNNLVTDMRSLAVLAGFGYPVVYDATHSIQLPGGKGTCSGGQREFVEGLCRAAVAFGCDGLFLEVHDRPDKALCDGPNMIDLKTLARLLKQVTRIRTCLSK